MIVTVSGRSGLRNAYRSVLSAVGSSEIDGASRWLEAVPADGAGPLTTAAATATATSASAASVTLRIRDTPLSATALGVVAAVVGGHSRGARERFTRTSDQSNRSGPRVERASR